MSSGSEWSSGRSNRTLRSERSGCPVCSSGGRLCCSWPTGDGGSLCERNSTCCSRSCTRWNNCWISCCWFSCIYPEVLQHKIGHFFESFFYLLSMWEQLVHLFLYALAVCYQLCNSFIQTAVWSRVCFSTSWCSWKCWCWYWGFGFAISRSHIHVLVTVRLGSSDNLVRQVCRDGQC